MRYSQFNVESIIMIIVQVENPPPRRHHRIQIRLERLRSNPMAQEGFSLPIPYIMTHDHDNRILVVVGGISRHWAWKVVKLKLKSWCVTRWCIYSKFAGLCRIGPGGSTQHFLIALHAQERLPYSSSDETKLLLAVPSNFCQACSSTMKILKDYNLFCWYLPPHLRYHHRRDHRESVQLEISSEVGDIRIWNLRNDLVVHEGYREAAKEGHYFYCPRLGSATGWLGTEEGIIYSKKLRANCSWSMPCTRLEWSMSMKIIEQFGVNGSRVAGGVWLEFIMRGGGALGRGKTRLIWFFTLISLYGTFEPVEPRTLRGIQTLTVKPSD